MKEPVQPRGFLVVLSGPSGVGKNTLLTRVLPEVPQLAYSVSATTRPPRPGERDGEDYYFLNDDTFDEWIRRGEFLEWAEFAGYRYGTPKRFVMESIERGLTVITDIDIQGARQIKQRLPEGVFVFLMPPSVAELKSRLHGRGTDSDEAIKRRIALADAEMAAVVDYDYWIVNRDIEEACATLKAIITAERCRVSRAGFDRRG